MKSFRVKKGVFQLSIISDEINGITVAKITSHNIKGLQPIYRNIPEVTTITRCKAPDIFNARKGVEIACHKAISQFKGLVKQILKKIHRQLDCHVEPLLDKYRQKRSIEILKEEAAYLHPQMTAEHEVDG